MKPVANVELNAELIRELLDVALRDHYSYVDAQMDLKRSIKLEEVDIHLNQDGDDNMFEIDLKKSL